MKNTPFATAAWEIAHRIFAEVIPFRRMSLAKSRCHKSACSQCASCHIPKILTAVQHNNPVTFVLPAFPGKSPNPEKVLGPLPDQAERLALHFLGMLGQRIKTYYIPGIKIILCSDGRVFSDVVGMQEHHVTAYQRELSRLIKQMSLPDLLTFNLDDLYETTHFNQMRVLLMQRYGKSLHFTRESVRNGAKPSASLEEQDAHRMYCGITRFLFEDSLHATQTKSRTTLQKEARSRAYEVIRRSNAWSELIAERFPDAVRLSIHPQVCGAKKLGIRLISNERWMTPWHGVAVETTQGFILLKRSAAVALGAELVYGMDGSPSHYKLSTDLSRNTLDEL